MNSKQKKVLWIGIVIVVLMGLFPPWTDTLEGFRTEPRGYVIIFKPPYSRGGAWGVQIDFQRLILQWLIVGFVIGGLLITSKNRKSEQEQKPTKESARSEENQKVK